MKNKVTNVNVFKVNPNAYLPEYGTSQSTCFDLRVCLRGVDKVKYFTGFNKEVSIKVLNEQIVIEPNERVLVSTGLIVEIPKGYQIKLYPRSSSGGKLGIDLANSVGNVDNDYRGELCLLLHNSNTYDRVVVKHGDKLVQGELMKYENLFQFVEVMDRPTEVGDRFGGFGSTGN